MKFFAVRSSEGYTLIACAANKDDATNVLKKAFDIHGLWGFSSDKVSELTGVNIPELDTYGKVLMYSVHQISV